MSNDDLWAKSAGWLADAIRMREVSAREVMAAHLERMECVNGHVNAVVSRFDDASLKAADQADKAVARGEEVGPLHGVPVSVKINLAVAGQVTDEGCLTYADDEPETEDAIAVDRMRDAGAIVNARTNMPDLGMRWNTNNDLHGRTYNAWNPDVSPGGSSGGAAVAVATGMSPLALASDFGGSLTVPAALNGVVSLRPTSGRLAAPAHAAIEGDVAVRLFYTDGVIARSVEDVELAFGTLAGAHPLNPSSADAVRGSAPRRALLIRGLPGTPTDPDVRDGLDCTAKALSDAGFDVVEGALPSLDEASALWQGVTYSEMARGLPPEVMAMFSDETRAWTAAVMAQAPLLDTHEVPGALARRIAIATEWSTLLADSPFIVGPVDPGLAWDRDFDSSGDLRKVAGELHERYKLTIAGTFLGLPTLTLPVSVNSQGLPVAVQLLSWRFTEWQLLHAASLIEKYVATRFTPVDPRIPSSVLG
ncbi:amidase [Streptomyces thinghirensis]